MAVLHYSVFWMGILAGCILTAAQACSPDTEFECGSGLCIPRSWFCDGYDDCGDNTDEEGCYLSNLYACSSNPCQHGGVCSSYWYGYSCRCSECYTGINCESAKGELCRDGSCDVPLYWCDGTVDCIDGVDEANCSTSDEGESDACSSNPCQHGGTCLRLYEGYYCLCSKCHTGNNCESAIGESCRDGSCDTPSYWCDGTVDCFDGVDEANCSASDEGESDACSSNPCQHGGTCLRLYEGHYCLCSKCHTGNNCESEAIGESCRDGSCVLPSYWCDGTIDCFGGVDEVNCSVPEEIVAEETSVSSSVLTETDAGEASSYKIIDERWITASRTTPRSSTSEVADDIKTRLLCAAQAEKSFGTGKAVGQGHEAFSVRIAWVLFALSSLYI